MDALDGGDELLLLIYGRLVPVGFLCLCVSVGDRSGIAQWEAWALGGVLVIAYSGFGFLLGPDGNDRENFMFG